MKTKNLFWGMLAVAGMLFATSCSQEEPVVAPVDGEFVNATFTLGAADAMGTRATIGTGLTADKVACAVYDANGDEMTALRQYVDVQDGTPRTATYNVRLAKGQDYRVAFFAYNEAGNHYDLTDLKSIKINAANSNVETRDAFTNYIDIKADDLTNKSNIEETVILKRPFAQLNLGIDGTEYTDAANAGVVITKSKITVSNVYNAFNAFANTVATDATLGTMTFDMNAVPTEALTVNGVDYTYLALNYLLVGDLTQEKSLTDVEFEWLTADGKTNNPTTHFINIPVQRNYRTNILGKLLTTPAEFNIVIDADFDTPDYVENIETVISKTVNSAAELQAAIDAAPEGQTRIVLGSVIAGNFVVNQKKDVHILIDGQDNMFNGTFVVNGGSQWGGIEGLSLQNIKFFGNYSVDTDVITVGENSGSSRYAHNVIISHCSFQGAGSNIANSVAIRAYQANDLKVNDCDVIGGFHSIAQITGGGNITFEDVTSGSGTLRGISLGSATGVLISNCNINTVGDKKYGIRHNADYATASLKIVETNVDAYFPVVVRCTNGVANDYTLTFEGTNTLVKNAASEYHVAIAMEEYDTVGETLTPLAGTVTVNGADAAWSIFK